MRAPDPIGGGIYSIRRCNSQRAYIGSAARIHRRWLEHLRSLRRGAHHSVKLQRAWNKYGEDNFRLTIIEIVSDISILIDREQYWMDALSAYKTGYNTRPQAASQLGFRHSPETIKKFRARQCSDETRARISRAKRGKPPSAALLCAIKKTAAARIGQKHSPETIEKMKAAQALRGAVPQDVRNRIRAALKGRQIPPEWRARMSAGQRERLRREAETGYKRTHTPEAKEKMRLAAARRSAAMAPS